jgi:hypothetical protein
MRPVSVEYTSLEFGIVTPKLQDSAQSYTANPPRDRFRRATADNLSIDTEFTQPTVNCVHLWCKAASINSAKVSTIPVLCFLGKSDFLMSGLGGACLGRSHLWNPLRVYV